MNPSRPSADPAVPAAEPRSELAGLVQPLRLLWRLPGLLRRPGGDGSRVMVLPGRGFGDRSTFALRWFLRAKGYRVSGWGIGPNRAHASTVVGPVIDALDAGDDERWALVGQSMGGYIAREVSRVRPDLVSRVITLGSPIYGALGPGELTVPITAMWSRVDRVVPPGRAVDRRPETERIEVGSTHFAMGFDPDIWAVVLERLARTT